MNQSFVKDVATLYLKLSKQGKTTCLVFPNKRSKIFFRKELSILNPEVQWFPQHYSSEEFVKLLTGLKFIDSISIIFEFYIVYRQCEGENAESFESFSVWAPQLIHDFQEIDLYCVDSKQLFSTIDDAYALKNWSPDGIIITENQKQYLKFWSRIGVWYNLFNNHLYDKGIATTAMAYRNLSEEIATQIKQFNYDKIIFAGFNALNKSEQNIISYLNKIGIAEIIWDADSHYINNEINEAGHFIRQYLNYWPVEQIYGSKPFIENSIKNIHILGVAKNIGQSLVAGSILDNLGKEDKELTNTSLVLCDEQLLLPMLDFLPENIENVNITMGFPMHLLPVSNLFLLIFEMHNKARINSYDSSKEPSFYYRDLLRILRNPIIAATIDNNKLQPLIDYIVKGKNIFIKHSTLLNNTFNNIEILSKLDFLFQSWDNEINNSLSTLKKLVEYLYNSINSRQMADVGLDMEALFTINSIIKQIENLKDTFSGFNKVRTLQKIFTQLIKSQTFPFYGEQLNGLQIMGLLETRNLDFKNLILLSVNEGVIPASKMHRSFIPNDIAKYFGLPTYKERDAIYAYHFYRMIQRAENIWFVYNTETDEFGKGEQSRFLTQLEKEIKSDKIKISKEIFVPELVFNEVNSIEIIKTNEILDKIINKINGENANNNLSPTALSMYLNCTLSYYFKYIGKIKIDELTTDEIESNIMGTIIHNVLQFFYQPFENKIITSEDIIKMKNKTKKEVINAFKNEGIDLKDIKNGNNNLIFNGVIKLLNNFLDSEISYIKKLNEHNSYLKIEKIESVLTYKLKFKTNGIEREVGFRGRVDRIDKIDNTIRIIDYKTGFITKSDVKIDDQKEILTNPNKSKALQLLQYTLMAPIEYDNFKIIPGIISLRKPQAGMMALNLNNKEGLNNEDRLETKNIFTQIIKELLDSNINFKQVEDYTRCIFCDFKSICKR
ncbi:MAG: PD-(D/E)XK nuclease family protein [Bacteroidota bacterium]